MGCYLIRILAFAAVVLSSNANSEDWPQWRGPTGNGVSKEAKAPVKWSKSENVAWKLPLPGQGGSTPIIWGNRIFLTSAAGKDLVLVCVDTSGKIRWQTKVTQGDRKVRDGLGNSASASPCTDGKHVWAFFGDGTLGCYDFDGKEVWKFSFQERFGKFRIQFGMTSTPLLDGDRLYQQIMTTAGAYVVCLDKSTGKAIWKQNRKSDARNECEHSYASAQLYRDGQREFLISHGADFVIAHRLSDGSEIWRCGGLNPLDHYNETLRFVSSPAWAPGIIIVPSAKNGPVFALKPDLAGNLTDAKDAKLWMRKDNTPDVATPLIHDGLVYLCRENGVLIVHDTKSGAEVYKQPLHRQRHHPSPLYAAGNVYLQAVDGRTTVVKAGRKYELVAANDIEESIASSPILANGVLYLRGYEHLYAIQSN